MNGYLTRLADAKIELLSAMPAAIFITGARATGKTTTARRHAKTVVRLDVEVEADPFRADPDSALRDLEPPVLLDEWQEVPEVLGAVKRAVDTDRVPGRFIVSGSVTWGRDPSLWPAAGRFLSVAMHPLTVRERLGNLGAGFLESLLKDEPSTARFDGPDLRDYAEMALLGGFPEAALQEDPIQRTDWLNSYLELMENRDPQTLGIEADSDRLGRYFEAYALNTAGLATDSTLNSAAEIDRRTGNRYIRILSDLGVIAELPGWNSNRLSRLAKARKRLVADTGLWAASVGVEIADVMSNGNLLGRVIETFVINQIRAEVALATRGPRLYHLRADRGRQEVDLIADFGVRGIVAIEIKAGGAPKEHDARHLIWLRDELGPQFIAGAVLHTGPWRWRLSDKIDAIPICALWS